jgi:hypothetical protein
MDVKTQVKKVQTKKAYAKPTVVSEVVTVLLGHTASWCLQHTGNPKC